MTHPTRLVTATAEIEPAGSYSSPGLFAVRSLPVSTQMQIGRAAAALCVVLGLAHCAMAFLPEVRRREQVVVVNLVVVGVGIGVALLVWLAPRVVPRIFAPAVHVMVPLVGLAIALGLLAWGPAGSFLVLLYILPTVFAVFLMRPVMAAINIGVIGLEYAIVLSSDAGNPLPVVQFTYLMFLLVVVGGTFGAMLRRADRLTASEQEARREASAATEAKSAFLATMSHEIRTPLNAVLGMTHLILDTDLSAEQQDFARTISVSGEALLAIINDILDFSKIEAGQIELEMRPFDIREVVEGALDVVAPAAAAKSIELAGCVYDGVPSGLVGDATRLRQILLNLLNNAVKFTPDGEVVLTVDAKRVVDSRLVVQATVRDTGIGIPSDRLEALFDSFTQLDASTTRKFGGTGLGLAISRRLATLMGGELSAESDGVGRGASFLLEFPAAEVELPASAHERDAPALSGLRALVVDDNATNRYLVRMQAESWGLYVRDTEFPREALQWIDRGDPFDVAILDMQMPEMDGLELAAALERRRGAQLPILIMSSIGRVEERAASTAAWLTKPVKPSQLFDTLIAMLGNAQPALLPPELQSPGSSASAASEFDRELATRHPLRILLAEDNHLNQQMALQTLARLGYTADVANNGREAIEHIRSVPYDVVLMDVQMPEMDGLTAARRICSEWPRDERPRLIAITANAVSGDREECLEAGMDDYVAKPIRVGELVAALERVPASAYSDRAHESRVRAALVARVGDDPDVLRSLLDVFLSDSAPILDQIAADAARGDIDDFTRRAHTLKSNAASFGADDLATTCAALEEAGRSGDISGMTHPLETARQQLGALVRDIHTLREELA